MTRSLQDELNALKTELYRSEREKCSAMTPTEYARYVAGLSKAQRAMHERMLASKGPSMTAARARSAEALDMDKRMGLVGSKLGCRREGSTMYFGIVDAAPSTPSAAAVNPRGTLPKKPAAQPASQRAGAGSTAAGRPGGTRRARARSEYERELDRRMGLDTTPTGVVRDGTRMTFNA